MIERLITLQSNRKQFVNADELISSLKTDSALRNEIEFLSKVFLHKTVSGCSNCYFDSYMQLISLKIEIAMEKLKCVFLLLAGALLQDTVNYDNDLLCSNANITDDLALYHLKSNPFCRSLFQTLPEDVDALIEAYVLPGEEIQLSEEDQAALDLEVQNQIDAENVVIAQIVEMLKASTTITAIKEQFKSVETVGTKKLTQRFMIELIDRAKNMETPVVIIPTAPVVDAEIIPTVQVVDASVIV